MTYCEGYDTCVDINYASGETTIDVSYDEYDAEEKERIRKILDAIGEERAKELADEMLNELFEDEWTELYDDDIQEAFFDAALNYADDTDAKIQTFTEILEAGPEKGWMGYNRLLESNVRNSTQF